MYVKTKQTNLLVESPVWNFNMSEILFELKSHDGNREKG